ncbi:Retrovirus-related Pol polyprotein from transposon RE1 [Vitis vinifera]|uniref:Retrovirus-related Pol polyprotein from transposon RE1 n=1 Tax=Vitis vinifera TaxID=29760 RepID=A0A438K524_VITVI|nr:Retrovirus-related Pol polyprotein from transposon RE1 [Vitis vinifera]
MTAEEFAKYSQYQEALKASTPVSALAELGKTCLVSSSNKWIIDSGATDHMTSNHKPFSTFRTHSTPPVTVADGSTYETKGSGTVKPTSSITLSSDLMTKWTFGKGHVSDRLYILDEWVPRPIACVSTASPVEAHCWLGHPSLPVLKKLCPQFDNLPSLDFSTTCFLINRMPTVVLKGDIPYKVRHPQKSLFPIEPRIFGCTCYVRDTRPSVTKLDPKALKCVFLGYLRLQKGYRCFSTDLNKYLVSMDIVFSEDTSFFSSPTSSASEEEDEEWLVYQVVNSRPIVRQSSVLSAPNDNNTCPAPAPLSSDPSSDLNLPISLRKASIDSISAPKTVIEALNHPGWKNAMLEEIRALEDNHTWKLVDLPQGKTIVDCKWVFAIKVNPDGSVARLKARLVARGYAQTYGWMIHQLDILHGDLEEEVYMEQPPGFVAQGECGKVCCLKKALYGLKQSPRTWFGKFSKEIQAFGMNKSKKDHSVFYKKSAASIILLVVYVDDIVITGNDHAGIYDLKAFMHSKFHTKDLGELKYFLGIEVSRSKKGMFLSQRKYVLDLLEEIGKIEAKPCTTPMVPNVQLMPDDGDPFYNHEKYRRVVRKLNYLTVTRPNIAYAVSVVSQFTSTPIVKHLVALEQILCYLKKALGLGILYSSQGHTRIECFSDADWAGSKFDRRSTTGYCVFFGGNLVAWKSKKRSVVSRLSAESEYKAMTQATCEIIWIHQLLCEVRMKCTMPVKLWCDNQAALHIATNAVYHERTKHIEVDCHFIREKIEENLVSTGYVKTGEQLGDIFTKSLNGTQVEKKDKLVLHGFADMRSTSGCLFSLGSGCLCWSSKKQEIIAQSTAGAEYVAAIIAFNQVLWLRKHMTDLKMV